MINHLRTLLLNRDGSARPAATFFLEEYVDPEYRVVALPNEMRLVEQALFSDGDTAFRNYRLAQYMTILHATEFEAYVLAFDGRITYRHGRSLLNERFGPAITIQQGSETLHTVGSLTPVPGRLLYRYQLIKDGTALSITDLDTEKLVVWPLLYTGGLSEPIALPGQANYAVRVQGQPGVPARWTLTHLHKPEADLSGVVMALGARAHALDALFLDKPFYKTFRELWDKHTLIQYRLAGVLLAYAHRLELKRIHGL